MPQEPKNRYIHTLGGQKVGFTYEPGAIMRSQGLTVQYYAIGPDEVLLPTDAAKIAISRFNGVVVYGRTSK